MAQLMQLASRTAEAAGVELVDISLRGSSRKRVLRLDIDRAGQQGVDMGDCQRVSEAVSRELDESDLLRSSYVIEVSSPGIDRPIHSADDIRRNIGRRVVVRTPEPVEGRREFRGVLLGGTEQCIRLRDDADQEVSIPVGAGVQVMQEAQF